MPSLFNHIKLRGLLIRHHNVAKEWGGFFHIEKSWVSSWQWGGLGGVKGQGGQRKKKRKVFCCLKSVHTGGPDAC